MKVAICLLIIAVIGCAYGDEKKTEKRGLLGLGYGAAYTGYPGYAGLGYGLGHGGLGYGISHAGLGLGYGGYGLGYGHGYLGHYGYGAPLISKAVTPLHYPAPLLGLGHSYPYIH